jgi:hypothetical protein
MSWTGGEPLCMEPFYLFNSYFLGRKDQHRGMLYVLNVLLLLLLFRLDLYRNW